MKAKKEKSLFIHLHRLRRLLNRVAFGLLLLLGVLIAGTVGYHAIEGWVWGDAAYATLLIISTLGFGRLTPASGAGQLLTSALIISGVGTLFYLLSNVAETFIETSLGLTKVRRMEREIAKLRDHYIICGLGRVGRRAAQELSAQDKCFVTIDGDEAVVAAARQRGWPTIQGDATQDAILKTAGIERASGLLVTTASDATNVFITLAARIYNEHIVIVARANGEGSEPKLEKAGANKVIAPEAIGGQRMVGLVLRPGATEVIDTLLHADDQNNWLEQTTVFSDSALRGQSLGAARLEDRTGVRVIAIR